MFDEELLDRLDADEQVRRVGRSAVLREAAAQYLRSKTRRGITERYRRAYGTGGDPLEGFEGWEDEGQWPEP